ncbi:hypothetical protein DL98DRAFT_517947 [Cadophora sp. DSE1049]|nr:hypothetical protein DL98DRAFT_517947 [Cadophora sp. DSE1049]
MRMRLASLAYVRGSTYGWSLIVCVCVCGAWKSYSIQCRGVSELVEKKWKERKGKERR